MISPVTRPWIKRLLASALAALLAIWSVAPAYAFEAEPCSESDDGAAICADTDQGGEAAVEASVADGCSEGQPVSVDAATSNDSAAAPDDGTTSASTAKDEASLAARAELAEGLVGLADAAKDAAISIEERPSTVVAPVKSGSYYLQPAGGDGTVLGISNGSASSGAEIVAWDANGMPDQRFELTVGKDGRYIIVNVNSKLALDLGWFSSAVASVVQRPLSDSESQSWQIIDNGDGTYSFENYAYPGLILDSASGARGTLARATFGSATASSQRFYLVSADGAEAPEPDAIAPGTYVLENAADTDLALSVPDFSLADGAVLELADTSNDLSQLAVVSVDSSGYASLRLANSGLAVAARGGLVGALVVQQAWTGSAAQKWSPQANDDGTYSLVSCASGLVLACESVSSGSQLLVESATDAANERWVLSPVANVVADGVYSFYSRVDNGKALDTADASAASGARAQLYDRTGTPAQKLLVTNVSGGITVQSLCGGKFLTAKGASVSFEDRTGGPEQVWAPTANASGGVSFANVATGCALEVPGGNAYNGAALAASAAVNGSAAQSFRTIQVAPIEDGTYIIAHAGTSRALDVADASRANGANVQVVAQNGGGAQAWNVTYLGNGYYKIVNARSKKALDVEGGIWAAGTNVHQWSENGGGAQQWKIEVTPDGAYAFVSACGGYVLEASGNAGWDGANVFVGEPTYSSSQQFRMIPTVYVQEDFENMLATFTTYSTNDYAGTFNMMRALQSFNGVVVQPGETLSFFAVAGPCGAAQGYLPGGVVGGIGYGGGICQASTTLYGAAIRAGMTIVDRQNHSVPSTYVPIGLDAMVSYGSSDFQFRNDLADPVKIVVYTYANVLTCEIWGIQPEWYDYIEPTSWYTGSNSAAAQRTWYKDGVAVYTEALPSSWYW